MYCFPRRATCAGLILLTVFLIGNWNLLWANDSAAEVAAGGIQLRKEARISLENERLTISLDKVTVEYEFLNTTDQDITTEVAFPTPPYEFTPEDAGGIRAFNDFRVWVDGKKVKCQTEVRAKHKGVDYTRLLSRLGIEIETFGRFPVPDYDVNNSQIGKLPKSDQENLTRLGLMTDFGWPGWTVVKTYHWHQVFASKKVLHVRHEYEPGYGFEPFYLVDSLKQISAPCKNTALETKLRAESDMYTKTRRDGTAPLIHVSWVKYILTTAKSWKTPIKDFELIVEKPKRWGPGPKPKFLGTRVCWDGEVRPADDNRVVAKRFNYIPAMELAVYFFEDYNR